MQPPPHWSSMGSSQPPSCLSSICCPNHSPLLLPPSCQPFAGCQSPPKYHSLCGCAPFCLYGCLGPMLLHPTTCCPPRLLPLHLELPPRAAVQDRLPSWPSSKPLACEAVGTTGPAHTPCWHKQPNPTQLSSRPVLHPGGASHKNSPAKTYGRTCFEQHCVVCSGASGLSGILGTSIGGCPVSECPIWGI